MQGQSPAERTRDIISAYYAAFNSGDVEAMIEWAADDIVHDVNQGERREGKDRFHAFCARMAHHYHESLEDIVIMTSEDGTRAAAEFNVIGTYLETETGLPPAAKQKYILPAGAFFALRGDKIARVSTYYNLTEWIMQVSGPDALNGL